MTIFSRLLFHFEILVLLVTSVRICAGTEPCSTYVAKVINTSVSITIDGELSDWEGIDAPAETLRYVCISARGKGKKFKPPTGDKDLSANFRCFVHQDTFYIAVSVNDDVLVFGEEKFGDGHQDDSVEIYFDGDLAVRKQKNADNYYRNTNRSNYDRNDAEIRFSKDRQGKVHLEGMGLFGDRLMVFPGLWESLGIVAAIQENATGYTAELKVPKGVFVSAPLQFGVTVGFNVMINDDDNGGNRDSKISWSPDLYDKSWFRTEMFGKLIIQPQHEETAPRGFNPN